MATSRGLTMPGRQKQQLQHGKLTAGFISERASESISFSTKTVFWWLGQTPRHNSGHGLAKIDSPEAPNETLNCNMRQSGTGEKKAQKKKTQVPL